MKSLLLATEHSLSFLQITKNSKQGWFRFTGTAPPPRSPTPLETNLSFRTVIQSSHKLSLYKLDTV